jgi:hypothetical protein
MEFYGEIMQTVNYAISTNEELLRHFLLMDPATIEQEISKLPLVKVSLIVTGTNEKDDPNWRLKIRALFNGLNQRDYLKECGEALSVKQLIEILDQVTELDAVHHWKLLPLLVGLPPRVFEELLLTASAIQIQVIKQEGITEPIQHQLTNLLHEWAREVESRSEKLHQLLQEITALDLERITRTELARIEDTLDSMSEHFNQITMKISKALSIAWNTNRFDLIDKMTSLKESCLKYNAVVIGHPHDPSSHATGLYQLLDQRLDAVYGRAADSPQGGQQPLEDDDPAIEGLARLGVWYLIDYWKIGLLPGVEESRVIEQEEQAVADRSHTKEREALYFLALDNLQRLGLTTIADLKEARVYSKEMLIDFILQHRNSLKRL